MEHGHDAGVPQMVESNTDETSLRRAIQDIQNNSTMDEPTKAKKMQELLSASWKQSRPASRTSMFSSSDGSASSISLATTPPEEDELAPTYHTLDPEPILGCKHYQRNCKIFADCCQRWINCRFCHDEVEDHSYIRSSTKQMLCMFCGTQQPAGKVCSNMECGREMARYYCDVCKFWDDSPEKSIFHCEKCGICRTGLREDYVHCDKCNACISTEYYPQHKCIERSLDGDCPICGENLFNSTAPLMFMNCGHSIHFICYRDHIRNSYQCPVCWKSLKDMREYFARIDSLLETQTMPPEYANVKAQILCNDCEEKTVTKYHFVYHKCTSCGSYNTKLIRSYTSEAGPASDDVTDQNAQ